MTTIAYYLPDVNDEVDYRQARDDEWEEFEGGGFIPAPFPRLVASGVDPETAADIVDVTIAATREERYGEQAETLTMVLELNYGATTPA